MNKILNDKQIEFGFDYFFKDAPDRPKSVIEISEYNGEDKLIINCTQLGSKYKTQKQKKKVLLEWCEFLKEHPDTFTDLRFGTKMSQELFDALCHQRNLKRLEIKWGTYQDISAIQQLENIELLHIGSGASVEAIEPLSELKNIIALSVENFQKINNYECFSNLKSLESLSITGDGLSPRYIKIEDIKFLKELNQLRFFRLLTERLKSKDYTPILELISLEHLTLRSNREVKKLFDNLIKLPQLRWGLLMTKPELYRK